MKLIKNHPISGISKSRTLKYGHKQVILVIADAIVS